MVPQAWEFLDTDFAAHVFIVDLVDGRRVLLEIQQPRRLSPLDASYSKAALAQHVVVWGLSSGIILEVVRAYRRSRWQCSSHGVANHAAAEVIVARCPHMNHPGWDGIERARDLVEYMLIYYEARHRAWFWKELDGEHKLFPFAYQR